MQLDIRTTNAKVNMSQPPADFEIERKQPKLIMQTDRLQIRIDQKECFNESGLMSPEALSNHLAQLGKRGVMDGIARRVSEGERLASVENGGNALAAIAKGNSYPTYQISMVTMPRSRPKIDFVGGELDIRVEEGYININFRPNSPQAEYQPGRVDIQVRQYPQITIRNVENTIDAKV